MPTMLAKDTTVLGACPHDCPDTCSMLVKVEAGRVTGVQGNAAHPFTQGRLCAKTSHYQERVYHPDRVLVPMRRTGPKGSGEFERISWDEALATIGEKWRAIIAKDGPTAILPYSYLGTQGLVNGLTVGDPFFNQLGATVSERTFCDSGASTAYIMTVGPTPGMDPESFEHSRFIILWACNMLSTNAHMWPFIDKAKKNGAKVVVIDPVKTGTSAMADQHLRPRPGTDGALALAMIHVVINEGLVDQDYVDRYTVGYEELAAHAAQYTPEFAAQETGIDAEVIRTLAREYATTQPSAIRIGVAIERSAGGGQVVRALACLPALVGAWRKTGGGLLQLPLWAFPCRWDRLHRADLAKPGTRVINQWKLGRALTGDPTGELGLDPPIRSLFVYNSNPLVVAPDQLRLKEGLAREDLFTVVSEQFMTDTARYADLVLPATTQVEQADLMFSWGHFYLTLNRQAVAPLGEAVPNSELFRRLARVMGFDDPFFHRDDEQLMRDSMDWDSPAMQGITMEQLETQGWARLNLPAADVFAPHAQGGFPTPSGKVELKASMAAGGNFVLPTFRQGSNDHQDGSPVPALPTYQPPRESGIGATARYPLAMMSPKSHAFLNSTYGNHRRQAAREGEQKIFLHPSDASLRGIRSNDVVRVSNERGSFVAVAKVGDETMPGVVVAPMGHWLASSRAQATPAALNPTVLADLGGAPTFSDNHVEVGLA